MNDLTVNHGGDPAVQKPPCGPQGSPETPRHSDDRPKSAALIFLRDHFYQIIAGFLAVSLIPFLVSDAKSESDIWQAVMTMASLSMCVATTDAIVRTEKAPMYGHPCVWQQVLGIIVIAVVFSVVIYVVGNCFAPDFMSKSGPYGTTHVVVPADVEKAGK